MGHKLGMDCKLYYGAAGATATNELTIVREVTLNLEKGEADITTRGNAGWRATAGTLKDAGLDLELLYDPDDAGFTAIKDAYFNNTAIALAILDGAGGHGLDADFTITNFSRNEPLEEGVTVSVAAKPTHQTRSPQWI